MLISFICIDIRRYGRAHLVVAIDVTPCVVAHSADLFRELEDAHAEVHFMLFTMGERVCVNENSVYSLERSIDQVKIVEGSWMFANVSTSEFI